MRRASTRALAAAALGIVVAVGGARADETERSARVVAALPTEGPVGLLHLYGMDRAGRAFDFPEQLRLWDWDLVLFRVEGFRPEQIGALVVCNERLLEVDGREQPEFERVCSPPLTALPEPSSAAALLLGGALVAALRRRVP